MDTVVAQFSDKQCGAIDDKNCVSSGYHSPSQAESIQDTNKREIPHVSVVVGLGWVSGGKLGALLRLDNHWSAEASYGYDIRNFIGASDIDKRYGFGLNWHSGKPDGMIVSLLGAYRVRPYLATRPSTFISGNIGLLSMNNLAIGWYLRFGVFVEVGQNDFNNALRVRSYGPNFDVGFNWSCF